MQGQGIVSFIALWVKVRGAATLRFEETILQGKLGSLITVRCVGLISKTRLGAILTKIFHELVDVSSVVVVTRMSDFFLGVKDDPCGVGSSRGLR